MLVRYLTRIPIIAPSGTRGRSKAHGAASDSEFCNHQEISDHRRHTGAGTWAFVNAALLVSACIAWGWMDYLYVSQFWTSEKMRAATDWLMLGFIATTMVVNLWLLRTRKTLVHLLGAIGAALVVAALWWLAIVLAGNAFHVAIGGDVG